MRPTIWLVLGWGCGCWGLPRLKAAGFVSSWRCLWLRESILCTRKLSERSLGATAAIWQQGPSSPSLGRRALILQGPPLFSCLPASRGLHRGRGAGAEPSSPACALGEVSVHPQALLPQCPCGELSPLGTPRCLGASLAAGISQAGISSDSQARNQKGAG